MSNMKLWTCLFGGIALCYLSQYSSGYSLRRNDSYISSWQNEPKWVRIPQTTRIHLRHIQELPPNVEESRHIRPETIFRISETLGALNTVGRYLVNMTTGVNADTNLPEGLPDALYTISKNVLGRNVTDAIAPFVKEALPDVPKAPKIDLPIYETTTESSFSNRSCITADNTAGYCEDLSNCPQLLLNLGNLRQSLCFKSLFVPGVCCPKKSYVSDKEEEFSVHKPSTVTYTAPTTQTPVVISSESSIRVTTNSEEIPLFSETIINPEDCGQPEYAKFRVVGGEEAVPGKWPWMAAIFLHGSRRSEFWCGGSLISATHILTAAHCTIDFRQRRFGPQQFTVKLGDIDLKRDDEPSNPATYRVKEIRAHEEFSRIGFYNDIAILVLDRSVRKSKYVLPLCLPPTELRNENFAGQRTTVVGWGSTYYSGKESTVQRQAVLPIWRNEDCNEAYFQPITSNFICAGYSQGGIDACQGDSGGPLMLYWDTRWIQIGIVSFGNKCGEPGYPGVYTRLTKYLDWIKRNTRT